MARFVLIDNSLTRPGPHNYEYAVDVLQAAEASGYSPVLVVNREFTASTELPANWQVLPVFQHSSHAKYGLRPRGKNRHPLGVEGRPLPSLQPPAPAAGWMRAGLSGLRRVGDLIFRNDQPRRLRDYARACGEMWARLRLNAQDRVLLPSMLEFDFLGLVRFLKDTPETKNVDWHVQFQFDIFTGRTPEHARQTETRERFRRQFSAALAEVPQHRVHFYGDTERIAAQYDALDVGRFHVLPWPVNRDFRSTSDSSLRHPLRVTCPGSLRREKGKHEIKRLVQNLWSNELAAGEFQLLFQGRAEDLRRFFPRQTWAASVFSETGEPGSHAPLAMVKHPLAAPDYIRLVRHADVGLLLYDSERYFARCSGILVEMLAAGIPVIVPAGCWLAEQIWEPICDHLDAIAERGPVVAQFEVGGAAWRSSQALRQGTLPQAISFGGRTEPAICQVAIPDGATEAVVSFALHPEIRDGVYVRVKAELRGQFGRPAGHNQIAIIGQRSSRRPGSLLVRLKAGATNLRLTMTNAYGRNSISISVPRITFLSSIDSQTASFPAGKVGLIAAGVEDVPDLLRDMTSHYAHYRQTARHFSVGWRHAHDPQRTIEILDANSGLDDLRGVAGAAA